MTIEIHAYESEQQPQVIALSLKAWSPVFQKLKPAVLAYVYNAFYPHGWEERQVADIKSFLQDEGQSVLVAVDQAAVVGWIGVRMHSRDNMGEIYILAVDPNRRSEGIATALIEAGITRMREAGMKIVMVETGGDPGHADARATYERNGFEQWPVARYFREL